MNLDISAPHHEALMWPIYHKPRCDVSFKVVTLEYTVWCSMVAVVLFVESELLVNS